MVGHKNYGKLYICGTPIGNLKDITLRSLETLNKVDLIAAEDTRHTIKLLNYFKIKKPLTSYHEHNEKIKSPTILKYLEQGKDVALVSDAGMPGICDPGFYLIRSALKQDYEIVLIPGVSALTTALVLSGFEMNHFTFEGFIPKKTKDKKLFIDSIAYTKRTLIFYDSPYRIQDTLIWFSKKIPNRKMAINREMTKKYEETYRGTAVELLEKMDFNKIKGELTVVLEGSKEDPPEKAKSEENFPESTEIKKKMKMYLKKSYYIKDIIFLINQEYNLPKNWIYKTLLKIKNTGKG